jgi:cardiolipin synthase
MACRLLFEGGVRLPRTIAAALAALLVAAVAGGCAQNNAAVERLPDVDLGEATSAPTLEAYGGAPILGGNDVRILLNGEQIFPALVAAIREARASITYAQYYVDEGPVTNDVMEALAERCRAGVPVRVLLDGVGALNMPRRHERTLREAGCELRRFRPVRPWALRRANNRNHRRVLVIDGRVAFTGGSGLSEKWMGDGRTPDHWRDTDIRFEGPAVTWMQAAFAENWLEAAGEALGGDRYFPNQRERGTVALQIVRSSPEGGRYAMYATLLLALKAAKRSVRITNPYFLLDDALTRTIVDRVRRGVHVEVLVPGTIDHAFVRQASRATWGPLLEAGVKFYEYAPALLHAKTIAIDGLWATVGSTNLDPRSFALCEELNVMVYDRGVARQLDEIFVADLAHARPIDLAGWRARGFRARVFELLVFPVREML